jgi:hypothetical protein
MRLQSKESDNHEGSQMTKVIVCIGCGRRIGVGRMITNGIFYKASDGYLCGRCHRDKKRNEKRNQK